MSMAEGLVFQLQGTRKFFLNTTSVLTADDASFAPSDELFTVAGHVAHVADSVDWFLEGAFGEGWDMDFEAMTARAKAVTSWDEAFAWFHRSFDEAERIIGGASDADLMAPIPAKEIMDSAPRMSVVSGIVDHTAHHRGSLAVLRSASRQSPDHAVHLGRDEQGLRRQTPYALWQDRKDLREESLRGIDELGQALPHLLENGLLFLELNDHLVFEVGPTR